MPGVDSAYLCPAPFESDRGGNREIATPDSLLAWARDIVSDGRSYLRLQAAYPYIQDGLDLINGESQSTPIGTLSKMKTDQTVRNTKEIVAAQTNIRIIPDFKTNVEEFKRQETILNKSFMGWQGMTFADRRLRKAWQYACAAGTGYIGTRYDPNYWYRGRGDIVWDAYGPLDVLPVGMGRQHDLQKAYTVALRVETPVHEAWRLFPLYVDQIKPARDARAGHGAVISQAVKFATAVLKRFGQGARYEREAAPWAMVDVFYIYVDDDSANDTGEPIEMKGPDGVPGTSWCYTVPFVGQKIPVGGGRFKEAGREDCLMYPNRRLIICVGTDLLGVCVNPDPECQASPYWHAQVPVAQLRSDDWAWNFLGFPITRFGASVERASIDMWRGMVDAMNARLSPPRAFDRGSQAAALAQTINTRVPNQVVGLDLSLVPLAQQIGPLLPFQWYDYPAHYLQAQQMFTSLIKDQMGVADAQSLARARQLPSGDSVEKLMEQLGPLIKDQSRNMEEAIRHLGELWKSSFFQFYTAGRRLQLLGPDGIAEEDYDYKPGTLIPYVDDEAWEGAGGPKNMRTIEMRRKVGTPEEWEPYFDKGEIVPQFERARWHKNNFNFTVQPYSLHEFNSISRKLFYIQLQSRGFPLDPWTLAELFDIRNFGELPMIPDPNTQEPRRAQTIMERWLAWMQIQAKIQQSLGGGQQGGRGRPGRPPTAATAPTLENKGGVRPIVRESKR